MNPTLDLIVRPAIAPLGDDPTFMRVVGEYITTVEDIPAYQVAPGVFMVAIPTTDFTVEELLARDAQFTTADQPLSVLVTVGSNDQGGTDVAFSGLLAIPAFAVIGDLALGAVIPATDLLNPSEAARAAAAERDAQGFLVDEAVAQLAAIFGDSVEFVTEDDQA